MDYQQAFKGVWASAATATATATPSTPAPARASVDASTIAYRFNWEWCFDPDNGAEADTSWWWARSVRVDPSEIIADDGEGHLWSVPFTTDGTDTVTFGEAQRVAETYTPVSASEGAMATAVVQRRRQRALASDLQRPDRGRQATPPASPEPGNQAAAESAPDNERTPMDAAVLQALARLHGLDPDTATEDQVNEQVLAAQTPDPEAPAPEVEDPAATPGLAAASERNDLRDLLGLPATATEEQVVTAARELRDGAQAGARVARASQASELDGIVDTAVRDGRIAPSARDAWRTAIDPGDIPDTAATARATAERDRLTSMATGRVPVAERGAIPDPAAPSASLGRVLAGLGATRNRRSGATTQEVIRRG